MRTRSQNTLLAVLIALLLHGLFLVILWHLPKKPLTQGVPPQKIQVHLNQDKQPKKQVVKIAPPKEEHIPLKGDFAGEFDSRVLKETQAANKKPDPSPLQKPVPPKTTRVTKGPGPKRNLLPTWQDLEQLQPSPPTDFNNHFEHTETAARTRLNTFEWKHAAYLNRVMESAARIWSPLSQVRRYDPAGALIGNQERRTLIEITLDHSGHVIKSQVAQSSGVFYLDDEALRVFHEGSFFPNPPTALFTPEHEEFTFHVGFILTPHRGFSMSFD